MTDTLLLACQRQFCDIAFLFYLIIKRTCLNLSCGFSYAESIEETIFKSPSSPDVLFTKHTSWPSHGTLTVENVSSFARKSVC